MFDCKTLTGYNICMPNIDRRKSIIQIIRFVVVFIAIIIFLYTRTYPSKVILGGKEFSVEVLDTKPLLEKGLSGHKPLNSDEGMLFIFQKPDSYGFWMKDMLFPIDIIWMDANWKIVYINKSLRPETYPKIFYPDAPSLYVLEISEGEAQTLGLKIGDTVKFIEK